MTTDERLERLVREHGRRAYGLALALAGQPADADDLVQRAVLVAARKREQIPVDGAFPWLARIIALEARNMRRKGNRERSSEETMSVADDRIPDPASSSADRELAAALRRELAALPEHEREALVVVHVSGLTYREASAALGLAPATLSQRVREAIGRLRRRLGIGGASLCAALALLGSEAPLGGLELAMTRWLRAAEAASGAGTASVIGGVIVGKKLMVVATAVLVAAFGVWWGFGGVERRGLDSGDREVVERNPGRGLPRRSEADLTESMEERNEEVAAATRRIGAVAGRVLRRNGEPRPGAEVRLLRHDPRRSVLARTTSDASGSFRLEVLLPAEDPARRVDFDLVAEDPVWTGSRRNALWLEEGVELDGIDLFVHEPARVAGRVLDRFTRRPLAGIEILVSAFRDPNRPLVLAEPRQDRTRTDAEGRFALTGLPAGRLAFRLLHDEEDGAPALLRIAGEDAVELEEGSSRDDLEFLTSVTTISFRLDREPGSGLRIGYEFMAGLWNVFDLPEDGFGPYRIRGMDDIGKMTVECANGTSAVVEVLRPAGGDVDLGTIELAPKARAGGRVLDPKGRPLGGAYLHLASADGRSVTVATTDSEGRFQIDSARPGLWKINVVHDLYPTLVAETELPEGDFATALRMLDGHALRGRVTIAGRAPDVRERGADGREEPLTVAVLDPGTPLPPSAEDVLLARRRVVPEADGSFVIAGLPPGDRLVAAAFEGRVAVATGVAPSPDGAGEVLLDLGRGGRLVGRVLEADRPRAGAALRLTRKPQELRASAEDVRFRSDDEGRYELDGLPTGVWYLTVAGESLIAGDALAERRIEIEDGETVARDLVLSTSRPILSGRLLVGGKARFRLALLVRPGVAMPLARAAVDREGRFAFSGASAGEYYLWLVDDLHDPAIVHRRAVALASERPVALDEDLEEARITGLLVGAPEAKVSIRPLLEDEIGADAAARFAVMEFRAEDGRFESPALVAGRYEVVVSAEGSSPWKRECLIRGRNDVQVDLAQRGGELRILVGELRGFSAADLGGGYFDGILVVRVLDEDGAEVGVLDESRYLRLYRGSECRIALAEGRYRVLVQGKLAATTRLEFEIRAGETREEKIEPVRAAEYRLRLEGDGLDAAALSRMSLAVTRPDGSRVEEIDLALAAGVQDQVSLAERVLRIMPLGAGSYRFRLEVPGFLPLEQEFSLGASEVKEGRARLEGVD